MKQHELDTYEENNCHRCLIKAGIEKMNNILNIDENFDARFFRVKGTFGIPRSVFIF
jgi:hypothetical protein